MLEFFSLLFGFFKSTLKEQDHLAVYGKKSVSQYFHIPIVKHYYVSAALKLLTVAKH